MLLNTPWNTLIPTLGGGRLLGISSGLPPCSIPRRIHQSFLWRGATDQTTSTSLDPGALPISESKRKRCNTVSSPDVNMPRDLTALNTILMYYIVVLSGVSAIYKYTLGITALLWQSLKSNILGLLLMSFHHHYISSVDVVVLGYLWSAGCSHQNSGLPWPCWKGTSSPKSC